MVLGCFRYMKYINPWYLIKYIRHSEMGNRSSSLKSLKKDQLTIPGVLEPMLQSVNLNLNSPPATAIPRASLENVWKDKLSEEHLELLMSRFYSQPPFTLKHLVTFYLAMAEGGGHEDMAEQIFFLLNGTAHIEFNALMKYINNLMASFMKNMSETKEFNLWQKVCEARNFTDTSSLVCHMSEGLGSEEVTKGDLATWIYRCRIIHEISLYIYGTIFLTLGTAYKLPFPELHPTLRGETILTLGELYFFKISLQSKFNEKWRMLYSLRLFGQSWATFCKCITAQGPTLLIIQSEQNYVIGAFAPASWNFNPNFFGDDTCFLFVLRPIIKTFETTGYNKNYQYFESNQSTLPNGLGMGGQFNYFGFFISSDFETCKITESCTTFKHFKLPDCPKQFRIKHIEVWGVGKPDPTPQELGERVASTHIDPSAKAILELAGKKLYAEDVPEEPREEL